MLRSSTARIAVVVSRVATFEVAAATSLEWRTAKDRHGYVRCSRWAGSRVARWVDRLRVHGNDDLNVLGSATNLL